VKDLLQLAKMHHGLGMAYQHLHQPARARQHLDKAQGLYAIESDQSGVYRIEIDLGDLMLQEGLLDSAEQHLLRALGGAEQLGMDRRGRGFILVTLAEVNLRKGNLDLADTYVNQAESAGAAAGERIVLSLVHGLRGRLEENLGDTHAADNHFLQAIELLDELEMAERLRDSHMEYAQILDKRGDLFASARHWRLAAEIGRSASLGITMPGRPQEHRAISS
jgi:tetratricopeptide (TPR) repeat protein